MARSPELLVLLDSDGTPIGRREKHEVHGFDTPLHLAFSCYLLDDDGRVLVTRRALEKQAWPGVWTNSFCGHPAPGEPMEVAIRRRAQQELGAEIDEVRERLPDFRYRAVDASGIVENEICPVYTAVVSGSVNPEPNEVVEWEWVYPEVLLRSVTGTPFAFSPWLREQLPSLIERSAFTGAGVV